MKRQPDGAWLLQVQLNHGHHHYRFLVDGKTVLDPAPKASLATIRAPRCLSSQ